MRPKFEFIEIALDKIKLLNHPLSNIESEDIDIDFAMSVKAVGILERPIISKNIGIWKDQPKDAYVIVSGHRRIQAARKLGMKKITCQLNHYYTTEQVEGDYLTLNMQRGGK